MLLWANDSLRCPLVLEGSFEVIWVLSLFSIWGVDQRSQSWDIRRLPRIRRLLNLFSFLRFKSLGVNDFTILGFHLLVGHFRLFPQAESLSGCPIADGRFIFLIIVLVFEGCALNCTFALNFCLVGPSGKLWIFLWPRNRDQIWFFGPKLLDTRKLSLAFRILLPMCLRTLV